jgi:hypothetical protein
MRVWPFLEGRRGHFDIGNRSVTVAARFFSIGSLPLTEP